MAQSISLTEATIGSLPAHIIGAAERFVEEQLALEAKKLEISGLLNDASEPEIVAHFACGYRRGTPLTLASTYLDWGKRDSDHGSELLGWEWRHHPRRPVIMRGARERLIEIHGSGMSRSANGYAMEVLDRYLRKVRWTAFGDEDDHKYLRNIARELDRRHRTSYHFWRHVDSLLYAARADWNQHRVFIGGKLVWLTTAQRNYLRGLHSIIRKTDRLDRRAELLRQAHCEGLAA